MNRELAISASYYLSVFLFKSTFPVDFSLFLQFAIASIASPLPYVNRLVSIKSPKERALIFSFLLRKYIYLSVLYFLSSRNRSSGRTSFKVPEPFLVEVHRWLPLSRSGDFTWFESRAVG